MTKSLGISSSMNILDYQQIHRIERGDAIRNSYATQNQKGPQMRIEDLRIQEPDTDHVDSGSDGTDALNRNSINISFSHRMKPSKNGDEKYDTAGRLTLNAATALRASFQKSIATSGDIMNSQRAFKTELAAETPGSKSSSDVIRQLWTKIEKLENKTDN